MIVHLGYDDARKKVIVYETGDEVGDVYEVQTCTGVDIIEQMRLLMYRTHLATGKLNVGFLPDKKYPCKYGCGRMVAKEGDWCGDSECCTR